MVDQQLVERILLGAGYAFLGGLLFVIMQSVFSRPTAWRNLFSEYPGGPPHVARYLLVAANLYLAIKFLVMVFEGQSAGAVNLLEGLDLDALTGASGGAYLLSKLTNGDIFSLFGRRRA